MVALMYFRLTYRGDLRGQASSNIQHLHALRLHFHKQMAELWGQPPLNAKSHRAWLTRPREGGEYGVLEMRSGRRFAALVSTGNDLMCELGIVLLRRAPPGSVVRDGGDLDNRLKTLLDALRIPDPSQVPKDWQPSDEEEPVMCLLSDDKLVTSLSITADRLLDPEVKGHAELEVSLMILVTLKPAIGTIGNLSLTS
jgi:hypothetical protein